MPVKKKTTTKQKVFHLNLINQLQPFSKTKRLASISKEQAFQSDFLKSSQESQVGMPLSASQ